MLAAIRRMSLWCWPCENFIQFRHAKGLPEHLGVRSQRNSDLQDWCDAFLPTRPNSRTSDKRLFYGEHDQTQGQCFWHLWVHGERREYIWALLFPANPSLDATYHAFIRAWVRKHLSAVRHASKALQAWGVWPVDLLWWPGWPTWLRAWLWLACIHGIRLKTFPGSTCQESLSCLALHARHNRVLWDR